MKNTLLLLAALAIPGYGETESRIQFCTQKLAEGDLGKAVLEDAECGEFYYELFEDATPQIEKACPPSRAGTESCRYQPTLRSCEAAAGKYGVATTIVAECGVRLAQHQVFALSCANDSASVPGLSVAPTYYGPRDISSPASHAAACEESARPARKR